MHLLISLALGLLVTFILVYTFLPFSDRQNLGLVLLIDYGVLVLTNCYTSWAGGELPSKEEHAYAASFAAIAIALPGIVLSTGKLWIEGEGLSPPSNQECQVVFVCLVEHYLNLPGTQTLTCVATAIFIYFLYLGAKKRHIQEFIQPGVTPQLRYMEAVFASCAACFSLTIYGLANHSVTESTLQSQHQEAALTLLVIGGVTFIIGIGIFLGSRKLEPGLISRLMAAILSSIILMLFAVFGFGLVDSVSYFADLVTSIGRYLWEKELWRAVIEFISKVVGFLLAGTFIAIASLSLLLWLASLVRNLSIRLPKFPRTGRNALTFSLIGIFIVGAVYLVGSITYELKAEPYIHNNTVNVSPPFARIQLGAYFEEKHPSEIPHAQRVCKREGLNIYETELHDNSLWFRFQLFFKRIQHWWGDEQNRKNDMPLLNYYDYKANALSGLKRIGQQPHDAAWFSKKMLRGPDNEYCQMF